MSKVEKKEKQYYPEIKEATYEVIKTALRIGIDESSNFIKFYGNCARFIRDSNDPEDVIRNSALKIFPDGLTWDYKSIEITNKYKSPSLRDKLLKLYSLYYLVAGIERARISAKDLMTNEQVDELLDRL